MLNKAEENAIGDFRDEVLGHTKKHSLNELQDIFDSLIPFLSEDQITRFRHLLISLDYNPDGYHENWSHSKKIAEKRSNFLSKSGVLPKPSNGKEITILSPSANTGLVEAYLQKKLGPGYRVLAGDLSTAEPFDKSIKHFRLDAGFLPFKEESIDVIYDDEGASLFESALDKGYGTKSFTENLFTEYHRVLEPNGILIVDGQAADYIDQVLGDKINQMGFSAVKVKWKKETYGVYQKHPQLLSRKI